MGVPLGTSDSCRHRFSNVVVAITFPPNAQLPLAQVSELLGSGIAWQWQQREVHSEIFIDDDRATTVNEEEPRAGRLVILGWC